jgi:CHAT domain-containing protein/Tfp pilus assembly protein PilF
MGVERSMVVKGHGFRLAPSCDCKARAYKSSFNRLLLSFFLLLACCVCHHLSNPEQAYAHARQTFIHGDLLASQKEAERGYMEFAESRPEWAVKFRILEGEAFLSHGESSQVLALFRGFSTPDDRGSAISILSLQGLSYTRLHQFGEADSHLREAEELCATVSDASCGEVLRARGLLEIERGRLEQAERYLNESLASARAHHDRFLESAALLNLGFFSLHTAHFEDAVDWSNSALRISTELSAQRIRQAAVGNLGWAYYKLGDPEKALEGFLTAEQSAEQLRDDIGRVIWLTAIAYVYLDKTDYGNAERVYHESLDLAKQIDAKEYIRNALIPLAFACEREGKFDEATQYADQAIATARADGNRLDELYPLLVKGQVAAQLHDRAKAESIFREVANDPHSDSSLRWEAQHSLARLEEDEGQKVPARREYEAALCTFETARSSVHHEESKLPFFTNAARIYDDYISFLVKSGQARRALEVADYSRGRTLAEGLGRLRNERCAAPPLNAESVAAKSGATILYYWIGEQQSYLWAITKSGVRNYSLPPASQINDNVRRYREALVNGEDVVATANQDGAQLYQQLVAPALPLLDAERHARKRLASGLSRTHSAPQRLKPVSFSGSGGTAGSRALTNPAESSSNSTRALPSPTERSSNESRALPTPAERSSTLRIGTPAPRVIIVPDGSLTSLNFETLLSPGNPSPHYWIEDATITNVQSLRLLTGEKALSDRNVRPTQKILLVGDAIPHPPEYPALQNAKLEMQNIEKHFPAGSVNEYAQSSATAAAFLGSKPEQYTYIHFVAHAVASSQVPLDSAVILSPGSNEDSFKLYARDIIQHHLHARLVTVSACYGAGTRSYNGEGLIGLSWAFLRAGARNTIGALWEVNDASTPQLMDRFYAELQEGRPPDVALRDAKLALMRSSSVLSKAFYWAPFQLYGTS